jgi:FKBP-type peptidyl-prolyl cis-trans isomerase 2
MTKVRKFHRDGTKTMVEVKVGDAVGFKSDYEQHGRITKISGNQLTLSNPDGFGGDYLRYATTTVEHADDCWID